MEHLLLICAWVAYTSDRKTSLLLRGLNKCHRVSPHFLMFVVILVSELHLPKQKLTGCFRGLLLWPWTFMFTERQEAGGKHFCLLCHTEMFLTDDSENICNTYACKPCGLYISIEFWNEFSLSFVSYLPIHGYYCILGFWLVLYLTSHSTH